MTTKIIRDAIIITFACLVLSINGLALTKTDINGPANSVEFGSNVTALPGGNIVVVDQEYSIPGGAQRVGAVYLYNGATGQLISTLTGSSADDTIGSGGITIVGTFTYLIRSPVWDNGSARNAGAVTFAFGGSGVSGVVSANNSLVGTSDFDSIGSTGVVATGGSRYFVQSNQWDNGSVVDAGAVTFCRNSLGCKGAVSTSNSLVGSSIGDFDNARTNTLMNGNYVCIFTGWDSGATTNVGAVVFVNASTGITGVVTASNSLRGSVVNERVGERFTELTNGNYVVLSSVSNTLLQGSATLGSGTTGVTGTVSASNSLISTSQGSFLTASVVPLSNGNYVVRTPLWKNSASDPVGASTFGNGTTGVIGPISSSISLVGTTVGDQIGNSIAALSNGNYVVGSRYWDNGGLADVGAATLASGTTGKTGTVTPANSLIGSTAGDQIGAALTALTNGNYVVVSPFWDTVGKVDVGAVTFGNGTTGVLGSASISNSLIGSTAGDFAGTFAYPGQPTSRFAAVFALRNGNYVVNSTGWDNGIIADAGASTFASGTSGRTGTISASNSLVGSSSDDVIGLSFLALENGNYVVSSTRWDNGGIANVGALTIGNGLTGTTGVVSSTNSLVGSTAEDHVGTDLIAISDGKFLTSSALWDRGGISNAGSITFGNSQTGLIGAVSPSTSLVGVNTNDFVGNGSITKLENGNYVIVNSNLTVGSIPNVGAITYVNGNSAVTGEISDLNSILGTTPSGGTTLNWSFDAFNDQLVVGQPKANKITLAKLNSKTKFDFDGDSKTDVSIFRPGLGQWWLLRSSNGTNTAFQFGQSTDKIVPADFTGDGKTDVAFWRPSTGQWFVMRSEDNSFYAFPFGTNGDIPAPGDYDGDGKADAAVFRPASATWFISRSSDGNTDIIAFGVNGDKPVVADYDGDGKDDIAIYRPSNSQWWLRRSLAGTTALQFGQAGDKTVQGDYTGDGKADIAFFRPSTGSWFVIRSEDNSFFAYPFGTNGDVPSPGDYDGDGVFDSGVFRPSNNTWYLRGSTSGVQIIGFGATGDVPLPSAFVN